MQRHCRTCMPKVRVGSARAAGLPLMAHGGVTMKKPALAALLALVTVSSALAQPPLKPYQLPGGDPYPSTYHAVPSAPVIIRGATVLTGTGERLEDTDVLLRNGRIAAIGHDLDAPPESTVVDGHGRW